MGVTVLLRQVVLAAGPYNQGLYYFCLPSTIGFITSAIASLSGVLIISLDRLQMIINSNILLKLSRPHKFKAVVAISWVSAFGVGLLCPLFLQPVQDQGDEAYCIVGGTYIADGYWLFVDNLLILIMILFVVCHAYTYLITRNALRILKDTYRTRQIPFDRTDLNTNCTLTNHHIRNLVRTCGQSVAIPVPSGDLHELNNAVFHMKLTVTVAIVLLLVVVCWLPELLVVLIFTVCPERCHLPSRVITPVGTLAVANSVLNIFVHSLRSSMFRREMKHALRCWRPVKVGVQVGSRQQDMISVIASVSCAYNSESSAQQALRIHVLEANHTPTSHPSPPLPSTSSMPAFSDIRTNSLISPGSPRPELQNNHHPL